MHKRKGGGGGGGGGVMTATNMCSNFGGFKYSPPPHNVCQSAVIGQPENNKYSDQVTDSFLTKRQERLTCPKKERKQECSFLTSE